MIVTCPGCSAKYRVKDASVPTGGAKMKCPKCGKLFAAHRIDDQAATKVPQPIAFAVAEPEGAASAPGAGLEWDDMMKAEGLVVASHDPAPQAPQVSTPPLSGGVTHDMQLHSFGANFDASGKLPSQPAASPAEEVSDPFRNIDIMAPASQPVAGTGAGNELVRPAAVAAPPPPAATKPATAAAKNIAGIRVREPSGELHEFKYLPPARRWIAEHPQPDQLEASIAGAPFANVTLTHAFSDLDFEREKAPEGGTSSSGRHLEIAQHDTFPPRPATAALRAAEPGPPSFLSRLALFLSLALLILSGIYAVWQFELLPLEPHVSRAIASITGARSPLVVPEIDVEQEVEQALAEAAVARDKGAYALAIINYRRVLSFRRNSTDLLKQLADCYQALGDRSAVAELRRVAPEVFSAPEARAPDAEDPN